MEKVVLVKSLYRNTSEYLSKEVAISGWIRTLELLMPLDLLR